MNDILSGLVRRPVVLHNFGILKPMFREELRRDYPRFDTDNTLAFDNTQTCAIVNMELSQGKS
jgi:hypothetical protein